MRRLTIVVGCALAAGCAATASAYAAFPYEPQGGPGAYADYRLPEGRPAPNDLTGKLSWMYAATPEGSPASIPNNADPRELGGVRGASILDAARAADQSSRTTTGRPDVTIAVLDSGIRWNDAAGMRDLRRKTRLNAAELPTPRADRSAPSEPPLVTGSGRPAEPGPNCAAYRPADDANGDGVFNVVDYACDSRVDPAPPKGVGPKFAASDGPAAAGKPMLDPQDVLIAFSNGTDEDRNGFDDDIVGWDFLDDDNDPYDDVQYGHGTGEARDSGAEADNTGELGTCPNCMVIHMRVGDSFIADVNRFAQAVIYAVDNDVLVVQEALGTLNKSKIGGEAVRYAYEHGVAVIASAADEAAQHHNWPSSYPHVILVNSVTQYSEEITPASRSYLQFNGCTNFSAKVTLAIPSVSCSSDATGRGAGMAGLVYSAALNAREQGRLEPHPTCRRASGQPCLISANEVRQLMASGSIAGRPLADDVNFAEQPEPSCTLALTPACTDPFLGAPTARNVFVASPIATTRSYPARFGHDSFYGWGRVNMNRAVDALVPGGAGERSKLPPEVEITAPEWFDQVDPGRASLQVRGQVGARGREFSCRVLVAPGSYPNNRTTTEQPPGDFAVVDSPVCNGQRRTAAIDGPLAQIDLAALKRRFPSNAGDFRGREPGRDEQRYSGRPNLEPYGFTIKVVATTADGQAEGEDRRNLFLHRDQDMLPGFPKQLAGDVESSPLFVDLDGDNRNELLLANSDGVVNAFRRDGGQVRGWPVKADRLPLHLGGRAFRSRQVSGDAGGAILASLAATDLDRDGSPEVVAADLEGKVYVWNAAGRRLFTRESDIRFSGKPLSPFANVREGKRNRTQHGFLASPVLVDLDRDDGGRLEIVAAAMDRHVYAWNHDGSPVRGFPVLVVDGAKVASIDGRTHQVDFNEGAGEELNQGAIIDTPAVGDISGDPRPEIVVGTNEEYAVNEGSEGDLNASRFNTASFSVLTDPRLPGSARVLSPANGRVYAIKPEGDPDGSPSRGPAPYVDGWPFKAGILLAEVLPLVGEGITGYPVIGPPVNCPNGGSGPTVAVTAAAGPAYVLNARGQSCYGRPDGRDAALQSDVAVSAEKYDAPVLPAFGHPTFGNVGGQLTVLTPTTGLIRALDVAAPEYQGGQDSLSAWNPESGQFRLNFPKRMNDLQFLTGPSISDIEPAAAGEEIISGSAHNDLQATSGGGGDLSAAWPKTTSDWTVANPLIGSFGVLETDRQATKAIVSGTRSGRILAYGTAAGPCTPGSWPRFHHDNANSGDYRRDAVSPGVPTGVSLGGGRLRFTAPGDDLLCGTARGYEVATSDLPITGASFEQAPAVARTSSGAAPATTAGAALPRPQAAGSRESLALPSRLRRFVAVRAVDEQGNVGRVAGLDTRPGAPVPRVRIRLSVRPPRVLVGQRARFTFTATAFVDGRRRAIPGATVAFAGRRVRTDRRGRAAVVARFRSPGVRRAMAFRRGLVSGTASVRVVRRRGARFTG